MVRKTRTARTGTRPVCAIRVLRDGHRGPSSVSYGTSVEAGRDSADRPSGGTTRPYMTNSLPTSV